MMTQEMGVIPLPNAVLQLPIQTSSQPSQNFLMNRGSEWKRWDLHIHTPGTALEDRFKGNWDEYYSIIESKNIFYKNEN